MVSNAEHRLHYLDTHAHLNLAQFAEDRAAVIAHNHERGVGCINIGTHQNTSELAVTLAHQYDMNWAIVGLHPVNVVTPDPADADAVVEPTFAYDTYKQLAQQDKVVGIGECGFDYMHNSADTYEAQRAVFVDQVHLANELQKPLMLHLRNGRDTGGRDAYDDALAVLQSEAKVPGNAHFYAGSVEQAKGFLELGYTISFTGVITFAEQYRELVQYVPLDMMHAETDCPYVAPVPYRGKRCEPWMVLEVYKKIAELKGLDEAVVREQLLTNARRLYAL